MCTPSPTSHCAPLRETLHCDARGTILSQIAWHRSAQNVTFVSPSNQALKYFDYLFMSKFLVVNILLLRAHANIRYDSKPIMVVWDAIQGSCQTKEQGWKL